MIKHLPNFFTSLNLLCGCFGIIEAFKGNLTNSAWLIGIAAAFDVVDGLSARLLKAVSNIGKQLDSFADIISFGLLPGMILFILIDQSLNNDVLTYHSPLTTHHSLLSTHRNFIPYLAFLIPLFSAFRLAKFNIDPQQTDSFIGLPTPVNAILIASLPLILEKNSYNLSSFILNIYLLVPLIFITCYLLIAKLPLFSLKFKNLSWDQNKIRFIFLIISLFLIIILTYTAIPLIFLLYICLPLINKLTQRKIATKTQRHEESQR